jgi:Pyruvate/2-oxoacid:ferredoxin oxidoreductase gamma subunit
VQLIKRLTNQTHNLQVMAVNSLREFLSYGRDSDAADSERMLAQKREKDRILRRIMSESSRMVGAGFRQAYQHTVEAREREILLMQRQRGIMRRILDSNTRVMAQGYNKLLEASKANKAHLQHRMRSLIKSLQDKDLGFVITAYNSLKQRSRMLSGEGMGLASMKKVQLIKRLTNQSHNQQVMAVNSLVQFLVHEKDADEMRKAEYERQQREKDRILRRIMDSNLRMAGLGFRQAYDWMLAQREQELTLITKQRGIINRILHSTVRLMGFAYNALIAEAKNRKESLRNRMKYLIKSLTDKDAGYMIAAYNGLKQRCRMLDGEGMGVSTMKKIQLVKRLTNQSHNLQVMAVNSLQALLRVGREQDELTRLEYVRQQIEKTRILKRIMDTNLRMAGLGFRQSYQCMISGRETERTLLYKQRGIMRRILDSNIRVMAQGYNKLIEASKANKAHLRLRMSSIIKSLTDKDLALKTAAYNTFKQRYRQLNGEGMGTATMKKVQLVKRLTNQSHNQQVMAVNSLIQFLAHEKNLDVQRQQEKLRQQAEKSRILKRIMDSNLRMSGIAYRQAYQYMEATRERERVLINRQQGIMRRILDSNTRVMAQGYNKLLEASKANKAQVGHRMRSLIKSLKDKELGSIQWAEGEGQNAGWRRDGRRYYEESWVG